MIGVGAKSVSRKTTAVARQRGSFHDLLASSTSTQIPSRRYLNPYETRCLDFKSYKP
jgi:hypothetical protein